MDVSELCVGCMGAKGSTPICQECGWDDRREPDLPVTLPHRTVLRDQYVFGRALGHGGFGITYIGWDLNLNMKIAVKEFLPGDLATRSGDSRTVTPYSGQQEYFDYGLSKFLDEARALARFHDHPNIVTVLNFFREHGTGYLVMSYLPGRTLLEYLRSHDGKVTPRTATKVLLPVLDALREVHGEGMLHRDISPDNIYLTDAAQVKLIDFGAARYAIGAKSKNLSVVLKPGFAPWEQYQSKGDQGPWTDVYAVGATMYRAVTGKIPPPAPDRIDSDELVPPSTLGFEIDPSIERAMMTTLSVKTKQRYKTVEEFQAPLLKAIQTAAPASASVQPPASPSATPPGPGSVLPPVTTSHPPAVEELVQRLAAVSGRVTHQLGRILPRIAMPSVFDPTMATVAAVVAGLIGLLGAVWSFNELLGLSPGAQIFAAFLPGLVLVNKAQLLAGLMTDSALLVGAIQWMRKDVRGPVIVWGFAWVLLGLCVLGMLVIPVFGPFTTSWGQLQALNRGQLVGDAISLGFRGLVPTAILVLLMWKGGGARPVAKGS